MNDKIQKEKRKEKKERCVQMKKTRIPGREKPFLHQDVPWSGVLPLASRRTCLMFKTTIV